LQEAKRSILELSSQYTSFFRRKVQHEEITQTDYGDFVCRDWSHHGSDTAGKWRCESPQGRLLSTGQQQGQVGKVQQQMPQALDEDQAQAQARRLLELDGFEQGG
jgi:hypothetical protein